MHRPVVGIYTIILPDDGQQADEHEFDTTHPYDFKAYMRGNRKHFVNTSNTSIFSENSKMTSLDRYSLDNVSCNKFDLSCLLGGVGFFFFGLIFPWLLLLG